MNTPTTTELYRQRPPDEAAELLGLSTRKLEKYRQAGDGPKYLRISCKCVRYRLKDLIEWQESMLRTNTIDAA